jgi:Restriction endonuclease
MHISPDQVRFIKLGRGGKWEQECIESSAPTIRFGFDNPHHEACLNGDWATLEAYWRQKRPTEVTKIINQTKDFYTLGFDALWITFYKRKLYWCFAEAQAVEIEPGGSRLRKAINGWSCTDTKGRTLFTDSLSGRLTRVQGFRGTICKVHEREYLLSRINGEVLEDVQRASDALEALKAAVMPLIQSLNWKDFELLVDLIFSRAGWQRLSALGKTEKSIDLELMLPVTGTRAFVQVKSEAGLGELKEYIAKFKEMDQFQEMFFVVHTAHAELQEHAQAEGVRFMGLTEVASLVVDSGLSQWLMQRAA